MKAYYSTSVNAVGLIYGTYYFEAQATDPTNHGDYLSSTRYFLGISGTCEATCKWNRNRLI
jgi:hypothetical protein